MTFLCEMCCAVLEDDISFCDDCFRTMPEDKWVNVNFLTAKWESDNGNRLYVSWSNAL